MEKDRDDPNPIRASGGRELTKVKTFLLQVKALMSDDDTPESGE